MKKIFVSLILLFFSSCYSINKLSGVSTDGFSHKGTDVYYQGELCAKMSAIEIAYDAGKIVREATFVVQDEKFDHLAINIIKYMREKQSTWEIEVELKRPQVDIKSNDCH